METGAMKASSPAEVSVDPIAAPLTAYELAYGVALVLLAELAKRDVRKPAAPA
jgi:hypothetical protein